MPRIPSLTSTSGAGTPWNKARYSAMDSWAHQRIRTTRPASPSISTERQRPLTYVPSVSKTWRFDAGMGMTGSTSQHQARSRLNEHPSCLRVWPPSRRATNESSWRSIACRRLGAVVPALHSAHFHRRVPAAVRPFFFIRPPHPRHRFACLDLVLIRTRVTREDHIFYPTKKEQDETLTPTRPNPDLKHHEVDWVLFPVVYWVTGVALV